MAFSERVSRLKSSLIREILAAAQRPQVMSFAGGLPAESMLPKVEWADMPVSLGQYGMSEGEPALREALAADARALGIACDASQVMVVSGSQQTLDLAAKLYIDKGTEILLEEPPTWRRCRYFSCLVPTASPCPCRPKARTWLPCASAWSSTGPHSPT
ncbi:Aminotransferase [Pseudomonas amygdali pv. sesami]|nr:Aminotransferase [Pseudomonas amygdali pv. sesami]KPY62341.1 Aminotransferase, s I and II [Pseudomonas amygdali pv. sesami]RMT88785.1 Aminotransferase, s I and II [Pseudomonas amygdali pv. sesami]RMU04745.1 Aminotransferase, s I and II [Pseudomonas amygdali pv. sesami]RMV88433.1 Aminotransferase, s I and II [Pseudomonas amygdali pv. sesami]